MCANISYSLEASDTAKNGEKKNSVGTSNTELCSF